MGANSGGQEANQSFSEWHMKFANVDPYGSLIPTPSLCKYNFSLKMKYGFMTASSRRDLKYFAVIPRIWVAVEKRDIIHMSMVS